MSEHLQTLFQEIRLVILLRKTCAVYRCPGLFWRWFKEDSHSTIDSSFDFCELDWILRSFEGVNQITTSIRSMSELDDGQ
jgi:hypothetical protein